MNPAQNPDLSIVIPTLNEAMSLPQLLTSLQKNPSLEILVVDGGSQDGTPEIALQFCVTLLKTARGRAKQLNAGAAAAHGGWLWFLHADSELPNDWADQLRRTMERADVVGGGFDVRIAASGLRYRLLDLWGRLRTRAQRTFYGDQGIVVRREIFKRLGGFADLPSFEDVEFSERMRRAGRIAIMPGPVRTSARRWQRRGWWHTVAEQVTLSIRYTLARDRRRLPFYGPMAAADPVDLVILTKAPVPGRVKTRLTPPLTPTQASELAKAFLEDTIRLAEGVAGVRVVVAVDPPEATSLMRAAAPGADVVPQSGGDLGARMSSVIANRFTRGASGVILIGSDHPTLARAQIEQAVQWLRNGGDPLVIGPADDGGYYLIGLVRPHPELFDGIPWSSASVFQETLARAEEAHLIIRKLSMCHDVDTIEDVMRLRKELAGHSEIAPATACWLQQHRIPQGV